MEANTKPGPTIRIEGLQEEITRLREELHEQRLKLDSQVYGGGGPVTRDDAFRWVMYAMTFVTVVATIVTMAVLATSA